MNQIARRRFMSTASLSWAVAAFVSLSSVFSLAVSAQTPPVGPPPQTTNDSSRLRSSGKVCGSAARSKHSETWRRSLAASSIDLKKKACS